jgi:hypothetical protein
MTPLYTTGPAFPVVARSPAGAVGNVCDHASLRLAPFEALICVSVLYRHDMTLPFSEIQLAPDGAADSVGVKAGIAEVEPWR